MKKSLKPLGFTLIELLVVIVIIGILATITTVSLNSARGKARDAKRISDVKQMQTALELYFNDNNSYPTSVGTGNGIFKIGSPLVSPDGSKTYMASVPKNPTPVTDGACPAGTEYTYTQVNSGTRYSLGYCLGNDVSGTPAGMAMALPDSINSQCAPSCNGKYCGDSDGCGGVCTALSSAMSACTNGVPKCGSGAACSGTTDTCTSGTTCTCGGAAACTGGAVCTGGICAIPECDTATCGDCSTTACGNTCSTTVTKNDIAGISETYATVQVGTQCWMTKNITNVGTMVNGGVYSNDSLIERWCPAASGGAANDGTEDNCTNYGALYAWNEAMYLPASATSTQFTGYTGTGAYDYTAHTGAKRQGVCPKGWHIPSDAEWVTLEKYLDTGVTDTVFYTADQMGTGGTTGLRGTSSDWTNGVGAKLLCTGNQLGYGGVSNTSCTATAGATASPKFPLAGVWNGSSFYNRVTGAYSWSASQYSATNAWGRYLVSSASQSSRLKYSKTSGLAVRCLKD